MIGTYSVNLTVWYVCPDVRL